MSLCYDVSSQMCSLLWLSLEVEAALCQCFERSIRAFGKKMYTSDNLLSSSDSITRMGAWPHQFPRGLSIASLHGNPSSAAVVIQYLLKRAMDPWIWWTITWLFWKDLEEANMTCSESMKQATPDSPWPWAPRTHDCCISQHQVDIDHIYMDDLFASDVTSRFSSLGK